MPDYPTGVPAAGWYTDPSSPGQERWWGGVEWTHDVRPLAAAAPAPAPPPAPAPAPAYSPAAAPASAYSPQPAQQQPVLANVPGGGINPFAAIDAAAATQSVGSYQSPFPAAPSAGMASFGSFDTGSMASSPSTVSASWYDPARRPVTGPPPTNGLATAGLVLSLIGANVLGIILSAFALRKARGFEAMGDLPVGRKRARWGLGLGIASLILSIAFTLVYLFAFQYVTALYLEQVASGTVQEQEEPGGFVLEPQGPALDGSDPANDGSYLRADYEQAIRDEYAENGDPAPDSVVCPDAGSTSEGSVIVCTIVTGDLTETRTAEYYADGGYMITTTSSQ